MSSSHKKTHKQKRPVVSAEKVNDDDYVQMEVRGDGNCFYYSLYGAAKYHVDPAVFNNILACFGIKTDPVPTPQEFARKVRVKLAEEIMKPNGIMEAIEAVAVNQHAPLEFGAQQNGNLFTMLREASMRIWAPTETVEYRDLQRMLQVNERELATAKARYRAEGATSAEKRAAVKEVAQAMRKVRRAKQNITDILNPAGAREHWRNILDLVSSEISEHPVLKNARAYETMTKQKFKDMFTKLLAGDKRDGDSFMYASQPDVELIKFFLSRCGTPLHIVTVNPRDRIMDSKNGVPILNVILLFRGGYEHYNYYVRGDKYRENEGRFEKPAVRVKKQHVAKGNTPETPKTPESNSSLSSVSNSNLSSLSSVSNSNSSNSTRRAKKTSTHTKAAAPPTKAAAPPTKATAPPQNIPAAYATLKQLREQKAAAEAAQRAAFGKNVTKHPGIKQPKQWNPFNSNAENSNNNANYPANIPPEIIKEGKLLEQLRKSRFANAVARPVPSAPPASPPRTTVASSTRKAKKPSSSPKGKSMSPTTRKLYNQMMAKEQQPQAYSAAAVVNNLPSNSNNSLPSNSSNNENANLQAALKASKEEHEKNAATRGRRRLIEGILDQYKQPAPTAVQAVQAVAAPAAPTAPKKNNTEHKKRVASILALYNQPQQLSKTQTNLIQSLGPKRKGGFITKRNSNRNRKH